MLPRQDTTIHNTGSIDQVFIQGKGVKWAVYDKNANPNIGVK